MDRYRSTAIGSGSEWHLATRERQNEQAQCHAGLEDRVHGIVKSTRKLWIKEET